MFYNTNLPPHLRVLKDEIEGYARDYGLDFYETIFEVVDADDLNEIAAYGEQRSIVPGSTEAVLTGSDGQLFLSVRHPDSNRIIALARLAIHPGGAGIFGLWVHPDHRETRRWAAECWEKRRPAPPRF